MIKKFLSIVLMILVSVMVSTIAAPAAHAANKGGGGEEIFSSYSTTEQPLSFVLTTTEPQCTEVGVWEFQVNIQNNSDAVLDTQILNDGQKGRGATIEPDASADIPVEATGAYVELALNYRFSDNPAEEYDFRVDSPGCPDHPDYAGVDCTILRTTPPDVLSIVGNPVGYDIVLAQPLPEGYSYAVDPGAPNAGTIQQTGLLSFDFTPSEAGEHVIAVNFFDQDGNSVAIIHPERCMATVSATTPVMAPPTVIENPTPPPAPAVASPIQAVVAAPMLPETGPSSTVILTMLGIGLLALGFTLRKLAKLGSR